MRIGRGKLWDYHARGYYVVLPTNIGWGIRRNMVVNHMSVGHLLSAAMRFNQLPAWYATQCQTYREDTPVLCRKDWRLVLLPVKPLAADPNRSWDQRSDPALIRRGLLQLRQWWTDSQPQVAMPLPGAGLGDLEPQLVLSLVTEVLGDTNILLADHQL